MSAVTLKARPDLGGPQDLFNSVKNTVGLPTIVRGEDIYIFDDQGHRYLDAISGAMTAQLGQGNKRVLDAMHAQGMRHSFSYVRTTRHLPNLELTEKIARLAGAGLERVHAVPQSIRAFPSSPPLSSIAKASGVCS